MGLETAAIVAIAGGTSAAIGSGLSFLSAGKARREANKAAEKASKALDEARKKLQVNYLKGLSVQKEPYELAREAGISTGAQIVQAAQEGDQRGVAAGATRAALAQQNLENRNRMAMGQELQGLQRAAALEDRRLQTQLSNLDLAEARGFQSMAADQRARQREANQAGAQGLVDTGQQLMKAAPLYAQDSNLTQLPNSGALVDNKALQDQIRLPRDPNFGVESQIFVDPASLENTDLFKSVSIVDNQNRVV
jgi:hypothetical protein